MNVKESFKDLKYEITMDFILKNRIHIRVQIFARDLSKSIIIQPCENTHLLPASLNLI